MLTFMTDKKITDELDFAISIATVDGVHPSTKAIEVFKQYVNNIIDYKTAIKKIKELYKQK